MASYKIEIICPVCKEKRIRVCQKKSITEHICLKCSNNKRATGCIGVNGYITTRQKYQHRLVWEKHFGKIPEGFVVHHKDGNRQNNDINNLELLPKIQHDELTMKNVWKSRKESGVQLFYPNKKSFNIEKIKYFLESGYSLRKIATFFNTSHGTIKRFIGEMDINYRKRRVS